MDITKLIQLAAFTTFVGLGLSAHGQTSELVLRCNVTMNKTISAKKEMQRVEDITLVVKEFTIGGTNLLNGTNLMRVNSPDSTWAIFLSANTQDVVEPYGWKLNQTFNAPENPTEISFYLNRFNGDFTYHSVTKDVQFFVKGSCRKPEAKF